MNENKFIKEYLNDLSKLIQPNNDLIEKIIKVKDLLLLSKKNDSKTMIFGNGGSAAISSHVSIDLTKNAKIRTLNFNEADLITCFSNDFGYEKIFERQLEANGRNDSFGECSVCAGETELLMICV